MFRSLISRHFKLIGVALLATSAWGAGWTEYDSGPFKVISDAGEKTARGKLAELEQVRHTLGAYLGKDELDLVWPVVLVLFPNQREYAPHALPQTLVDGPDSTLAAWTADVPLPQDLLRAVTQQLIEDNANRMPAAIEQGLCDLMATVQAQPKDAKAAKAVANATASPGELPPDRMKVWAKLNMLATQPVYSGKLRIYFNNLQQGGDEELAAHNAFNLSAVELNKRAAEYLAAGQFAVLRASGTPINLDHDFNEKQVPAAGMTELFAELMAQGKDFPPESPRGLLKQGTRPELEDAAKANRQWAEPHEALAKFYGDPVQKVKELKLAATLEPRNSGYWQALAEAQEDAGLYADSDKSWIMAERAAATDEERATVHKERVGLEERRTQADIEAKKSKITAAADDLEQVKKAAQARIHAAEAAANNRNGALAPGTTVVPWWSDEEGEKLSGSMTNVDCLKDGQIRLTVKPNDSAAVKLIVRDPNNLAVKGANEVRFSCGPQKPAKAINLVHDGKADATQGTVGNVRMVELP